MLITDKGLSLIHISESKKEQAHLHILANRTAVPDDDVLVVRQPHALHEVVTKFRPVRIRDVYKRQKRGVKLPKCGD